MPARASVHVAAGQLVHRGRLVSLVTADIALDQLDGAGEALTPGQLYYAVLSARATGITVTKGRRGSAPLWEPPLAASPPAPKPELLRSSRPTSRTSAPSPPIPS